MFKKVLQSLTRSLGKPGDAKKPVAPPARSAAETAKADAAKQESPKPAAKAPEARSESPLKKIAAPPAAPPAPARSPEELCGIEAKMNKDQVRDRLKLLYRRFNRAASSLDARTRAEADQMLDAIVQVREKTFGAI